jgi:hypothetical protein
MNKQRDGTDAIIASISTKRKGLAQGNFGKKLRTEG